MGRQLIGTLKSERSAGGFTIGHWLSPASARPVEPHGHDRCHLVLVTAGHFLTEAVGCDSLHPLIFNPAGTFHADRFERQGAFVGVTLDAAMDARVRELALPAHPVRIQGPRADGIAIQLIRASRAGSDEFEDDVVESLCLELFGKMEAPGGDPDSPPPWLALAAEYLRDGDDFPNVEAVARVAQVHPIHLTRSFRRHFRCTPGEYRRAHKVRLGANLLLRARTSVADVAAHCGFADQSHLVRSFRRHFGMTPREFRQAAA